MAISTGTAQMLRHIGTILKERFERAYQDWQNAPIGRMQGAMERLKEASAALDAFEAQKSATAARHDRNWNR